MSTAAEIFDRALSYHQDGRLSEAEALYQQVLQSDPAHADAWHLAGLLKYQKGQPDAAIPFLRRAVTLNPRAAPILSNLGVALAATGRIEEAKTRFMAALDIDPFYVDALSNLGNVLRDLGQFEEAAAGYRRALLINPHHASAHYNLGNVMRELDRVDEAAECFCEALRSNPQFVDAYTNLGRLHKDLGEFDKALDLYEQALRIDPHHELTQVNRGLLQLLRGNFQEGWPGYEHRWVLPSMSRQSFKEPRWDGSPLAGRTILLYADQGLGDTIQFIRYAPLVKERGGKVLVQCQPQLKQLLESFPGIDRLVIHGDPVPDFDVQSPLLSLPGLYHSDLENIPTGVPYLNADDHRVAYWREEMAGHGPGFRIGIVWQGNPKFTGDRQRSIALQHFAPLAGLDKVRLFSLQIGPGLQQLHDSDLRHHVMDLGSRFDPGTMADVAAVLKNLDLLISSDTAVPHLAGALGVPVWVALSFVPDWCWLLEREDSPWYPTMRLFRQKRLGDWPDVFARIIAAVRTIQKA